jgi:membrane-associated HD superfamily phosphohydrolase
MNLLFLGIIIFIILALVLSSFAKANTQKISKNIRLIIILLSVLFGIALVIAGRILLAAPIFLLLLPLIKLKSGLSLFKALMIFRLLNRLRQQGRFSYTSGANFSPGSSSISLDEAYDLLNCKKGDSKEKIKSNYKKLMLRVHPDRVHDVDSTKISQVLTEAKDLIIKTDFS